MPQDIKELCEREGGEDIFESDSDDPVYAAMLMA